MARAKGMKTVDIPDELYTALQERAAAEHISLRAYLSIVLWRHVRRAKHDGKTAESRPRD